MIKEFIPHITINNVEKLGCPRPNELCIEYNLPFYIFHMNLNPKQCTFYKIFALRKWFINNT